MTGCNMDMYIMNRNTKMLEYVSISTSEGVSTHSTNWLVWSSYRKARMSTNKYVAWSSKLLRQFFFLIPLHTLIIHVECTWSTNWRKNTNTSEVIQVQEIDKLPDYSRRLTISGQGHRSSRTWQLLGTWMWKRNITGCLHCYIFENEYMEKTSIHNYNKLEELLFM